MDSPEPKKPFHIRLMEKLAASRFFTFSALIHVFVILLGGSVVFIQSSPPPPDFTAPQGGLVSDDPAAPVPPDPPAEAHDAYVPPPAQITPSPVSVITTNTPSVTTIPVGSMLPTVRPPDLTVRPRAERILGKGPALGVPDAMKDRIGADARARAIKDKGGMEDSEKAVMRGLRWLVKNQNADGSWGPSSKGAMTGFGLLSFLGHGETPVSAEFGPAIQKALDWMTENGEKFDGRLNMASAFAGNASVYEHAIATYALGEYYSLTKDERVAGLLKKAVAYIVDGQSPDGGWVYGYTMEGDGDTSVTGWQIQALKAAHLTGLNMPGVDQALDKAMIDLKRVQGPKGGFGYHQRQEEKYSLTGVGVLCTYFWKQEKNKSIRDGIDFILKETENGHPVEYKSDKADLYAWYYNTQACLMVGGTPWTKWNHLFQSEVVKNQGSDGAWPPMTAKSVGEFQTGPDGLGPLYRTNLCILMLEVYYRYMPSTK